MGEPINIILTICASLVTICISLICFVYIRDNKNLKEQIAKVEADAKTESTRLENSMSKKFEKIFDKIDEVERENQKIKSNYIDKFDKMNSALSGGFLNVHKQLSNGLDSIQKQFTELYKEKSEGK